MKGFIVSLLFVVVNIPVFGQYRFTLDISTKTLSNKDIILNIFNNLDYFPIKADTLFIKNGHHIISGEVKQPSNFAALYVSHEGRYIDVNFVLDSGRNNLVLELPSGGSKYLTFRSDARGNIIFEDLNNILIKIADRYRDPATGYLKIPREINNQIRQLELERLETYPNDFGSLIYLYRMSRSDALPSSAKNNLATLAKFSEELRNSELGKQLYEEETSLIKNKIASTVGNQVKTFTIPEINNNIFSNSSLKGQPYIIVFSAIWCAPCQHQLPRLKRLYETYKDKGLKVVYFNDDDDVALWKEHVSKNKLTWINVSEKLKPSVSKIQKSFGVYSIPTCLVIDKKGIIVYNSDQTDPGIDHIENYIKKVLE